MEIFLGIFIVFGGILLVAFLRSLTTLFHELGHAIPALAFSDKEVKVYVGSYGDISNTLKLGLGRLKIFLKFNFFDWKLGMCTHASVRNVWQRLFIIIGGPIASLIVASIFLFFIIKGELSDHWIFVSAAFMLAAVVDFVTNIYPSEMPVTFHDNSVGYSDGQQLLRLYRRFKLPDEFFEAEKLFFETKYDEAERLCESLIQNHEPQKETLKLATKVLIAKRDYVGALEIFGELQQVEKLVSEDFFMIGFLYKKLNQSDAALKHLNQSIHLRFQNPVALNSRGEIFMEQGKLEVAGRDFTAATHYSPTYGEAYRNLGLLYLKVEETEKAFDNFAKAEKFAPNDAFVYYGWGLYYEFQKDLRKALENFKKAEDMNIDYHAVRFKIAAIENELGI